MSGDTKSVQRSSVANLSDPGNLQELVWNLQEGIYITNEAGHVLDANPAFLEVFGVSSLEEMRQHNITDFVDPELRAWKLKKLEQEGSIREFEVQVRRKDGTARTVLDTGYVRKDAASGSNLYFGVLVDITMRKEMEEQLREQSIRDPLTGCFNRRYLKIFESTSNDMPGGWGCIVIDIDHFKLYNDQRGHQAGDEVLVKLSRFLMRRTRAEEAVVRMGGDEFLVLMGHADESHTEAAAKRIEKAAEAEYMVPFSLGWSSRIGREPLEKTMDRADQNLYSIRTIRRAPEHERRAQ